MACDTIKIETLDADEVVSIVTQGPQGPSGAEAATLTTTGDLLYRAALANDRLPIGSEGQVLKVSSGLPAWGNESGAVTSVNGETGAVVLDAADVGAQGAYQYETLTITGNVSLSSARAKYYNITTPSAVTAAISLPTGQIVGDRIIIAAVNPWASGSVINIEPIAGAYTAATITQNTTSVEFLATGTTTGAWSQIYPVVHVHAAADITSGTLDIARIPTGTGSTQVALGDHTHTQLHDKSHSMTDATSHTAGNHKVFYSDGSGQIQELALGNSGEVLTSNGASAAPSFAAASGGVSAIGTSAADILSVSGSDLVADDPNADRLVMYDDSASKLTHATAGKGLSFDGTTLNSATAFPVDPISRGPTYISYIGATSSGGNSSSAVNTSGGYVIFAPVYIRKSGNYTTFSCIVSTAGSASSLGKMALYTIDPTDATPDALVCESGTFTTDSTGLKQPTMASTFVNEGWYYMALGTNSTTNMAFYGDTMITLRGVFSGAAFNTAAVLLDYSQKLYADFWPNPWDGTNTTFRNAFHPITSLT